MGISRTTDNGILPHGRREHILRQGQFIFLSDRKAAVSKVRQTQPKAEDPETNEQITKPDMFPKLAPGSAAKRHRGKKYER